MQNFAAKAKEVSNRILIYQRENENRNKPGKQAHNFGQPQCSTATKMYI